MKAIGIHRFGGVEVLEKLELPTPKIQSHEILVRIVAAGVNPVDWKIRKGLLQGRLPHTFPIVLGWECSGVVEEVGRAVSLFKKGDEVFAYTRKEIIHDGSYAEAIALENKHLALKPKNLSFEEAAVIPLAGLTAYQSLFESLKLMPHETVLIHAGAGGVGGYAIQLAKHRGARVFTTTSSSHFDYVKSLGADEIIDYRKVDFVEAVRKLAPQGIDAVFDTVGDEAQRKSAEVLKEGGRITSILALDEPFFKERGLQPSYVFVRPEATQLETLKNLVEERHLRVKLAEQFPLDKAAEAHALIEAGHTEGKIALII